MYFESPRPYNKTERFYRRLEEVKERHMIEGVNEKYWNDFKNNTNKSKISIGQYKSSIQRFLEFIDKDVLTVTITDIENYLNENFFGQTKINQERYIKSFILYTIQNNINKALEYTNKELMIELMPIEYKMVMDVLSNKNNR
jgi:site-specific recombinase XerD